MHTDAPESKSKSYSGGCIFVDAATGHIDVQLQTFFTADETIEAIRNYKAKCQDNWIIVQECQFDNESSFTSQTLRDFLREKGQTSQFSGPGSHHQNGKAKRGIRTVMGSARTMLLHSASHWSDVADWNKLSGFTIIYQRDRTDYLLMIYGQRRSLR